MSTTLARSQTSPSVLHETVAKHAVPPSPVMEGALPKLMAG